MRRFFYNKNSIIFMGFLLMMGCQPQTDSSQSALTSAESNSEDSSGELSFTISDDTVTLSSDSILSIKSSRYQPSLGLQGKIEPIRDARIKTAKAVTVEKVLVEEGQWVEKGAPLLILHRQVASDNNANAVAKPANSSTDKSSALSNTSERITNRPVADNQAKPALVDTDNTTRTTTMASDTAVDGLTEDNSTNKTPPTNSDTSKAQTVNEPALDNKEKNIGRSVTASKDAAKTKAATTPIIVRASFAGRIKNLSIADEDKLTSDSELLQLVDDSRLKFIATLPIQAEPQLSVGQNVNFTTQNAVNQRNLNQDSLNQSTANQSTANQNTVSKYTGQVSKLSVGDSPEQLNVHVQILKNDANLEGTLKTGMTVMGRVDYGQIAVGTIVPASAIHDVDLTGLQQPPYQPLTPLSANIWIVKQDQRLTRQPVEVIEYHPITKQYLIAGVNNDSLICLANLPVESAGKKVLIS